MSAWESPVQGGGYHGPAGTIQGYHPNTVGFSDEAPGMQYSDASGAGNDLCFGCGQPGHRRAECPSAEPLSCNYCKAPDHLLRDCPVKPALVCNNCGEDGHTRSKCDKPAKSCRPEVADVDVDAAWQKIQEAVDDRDATLAREGCEEYAKARGNMTLKELQQRLFDQNIGVFLIGMETELLPVYTNIDLQGNKNKKYTVSCRFQETAQRPREREHWPRDRAEILSRLDDAGFKGESGAIVCRRCSQVGHTTKECPQEAVHDTPKISCYNCGGEGHRTRDCKQPRVDKFACKNCGQSDHKAADCTEEPNTDNVECRRCNEMGHFAKDCPNGGGVRACRNCGEEGHIARDCEQPVNEANILCRNCEATGHRARDCPQPKDWSKVQCHTCQEFGHTSKKCPQAPPEDIAYEAEVNQTNNGYHNYGAASQTFGASGHDGYGSGHTGAGVVDSWGSANPDQGGSGW